MTSTCVRSLALELPSSAGRSCARRGPRVAAVHTVTPVSMARLFVRLAVLLLGLAHALPASRPTGDLYARLGVPAGASDADIRKAWRAVAKKLHPDAQGGDESAFRDAAAAYEVLSDPEARRSYDADRSHFGVGRPRTGRRVYRTFRGADGRVYARVVFEEDEGYAEPHFGVQQQYSTWVITSASWLRWDIVAAGVLVLLATFMNRLSPPPPRQRADRAQRQDMADDSAQRGRSGSTGGSSSGASGSTAAGTRQPPLAPPHPPAATATSVMAPQQPVDAFDTAWLRQHGQRGIAIVVCAGSAPVRRRVRTGSGVAPADVGSGGAISEMDDDAKEECDDGRAVEAAQGQAVILRVARAAQAAVQTCGTHATVTVAVALDDVECAAPLLADGARVEWPQLLRRTMQRHVDVAGAPRVDEDLGAAVVVTAIRIRYATTAGGVVESALPSVRVSGLSLIHSTVANAALLQQRLAEWTAALVEGSVTWGDAQELARPLATVAEE